MKNTFRNETKSVLALMLPILITQFAQAGYGLIDTIMAGHISATDLAAISVAVSIWFPVMVLSSGIMLATSPLIAEAIGKNNQDDVCLITHQSLWIALFLGVFAGLFLYFMPQFFHVFNIPENLHQKAGLFLQTIAFGLPAVTLTTVLRGYTESLGFPKIITVISLISLVVLIPFNYIFMYGAFGITAMGSAGAGVANAIVQWLVLISLFIYLQNSVYFQNVRLLQKIEYPDWIWFKRIIALGLPIGFAIFFEVSIFSSASLVISPLGDHIIAANQIAMSITGHLFMIPLSLAIALTIRVGQYYGAKDWQNLIQVQKVGFMIATIFAMCTMFILWFARPYIVQAYTHDIAVQHIAVSLVAFAVMYQLMDAWQVTASGCLRGLQQTKAPMIMTFVAYWLIAFPIGLYLTRYTTFAEKGVWIGLIIGLSVGCGLLIWQLKKRNQALMS